MRGIVLVTLDRETGSCDRACSCDGSWKEVLTAALADRVATRREQDIGGCRQRMRVLRASYGLFIRISRLGVQSQFHLHD